MANEHNVTVSRFAAEIGAAVATAILGAIVAFGATEFGIRWADSGPEPGAFPFYVGLLIVAGSLANVVQALRRYRGHGEIFIDAAQARRLAAFFVPILLFVAAAVVLGLYVATALYLCAVMSVQGGYRLVVAVPVALGVAAFFYGVMEMWFRVPLLKGPLEALLGLH